MIKILRRIYKFLLPEERKTSYKVIATIIINTLLDFISLAALLPILYYLLEGMENRMENIKAVLLFSAIAIFIILVKCLISTKISLYQNRFFLSIYKRLSQSLYASYYDRGLLFIREQGSNRLDYQVNSYCYAFSYALLAPIASILGEGLLLLLVTVVLLAYAPLTAVILIMAFIPFMLIYTLVIRKRVKIYGEKIQKAKREQFRLVSETFQGYSELKVNNAFGQFSDNFAEGNENISQYHMKMIKLTRFPLMLSELTIVAGLVLLVLFGQGDITLLIGTFAIAAFRLLPAMRSILSGWTEIHNSLFILETLEEGMSGYSTENKEEETEINFEKGITLRNVSYTYPNGENVLNDFNAYIAKGEQVGFSGYSGAGKSTLFNLILGFLKPDSGEILIDDTPLDKSNQNSWLHKVGYVSQDVFVFNGTITENITIGCNDVDTKRVHKILSDVCLISWVDTLPDGMNTLLGERGCNLSGGQRQRIGIARSLYRNIEVLLMDEATSSLDDETEAEIITTLERLKKQYTSLTILSIAHRKSSLVQCDRIINLGKNEQ